VTPANLAIVDELRALPYPLAVATLARLEEELGPEAIAALRHDFRFWARPSQSLPDPEEIWTGCVWKGEYGTGKTWTAVQLFLREILAGRAKRPRIIAASGAAIENTVIDGASGIRAWLPPEVPFEWQRSKGYEGEAWIAGVKVLCCSADAPGQAIGAGVDLDLRDDPAGWLETCGAAGAERAWSTASRSCREGLARWITSTTPEGVDFIAALLRPGQRRGVIIRDLGRPEDNAGNLSPAFLRDTVADMRAEGKWLAAASESPFAAVDLSALEEDYAGALVELAIAIDPALSSSGHACEVGIVGGGRDARSTVHVTHDASGVLDAGKDGWPSRAWDLAEELQAMYAGVPWRFLVENNRGGNQPAALLRGEERVRRLRRGQPEVSICEIVEIRADKDKCKRAVSPARLAAQGQVRFARDLRALKGQLKNLTPDGKSTDRADAAVHLVNDLAGLGEREARAAADEREAADLTAQQCEAAAAMNALLAQRASGRAPEPGPMKVEGALPGDARYPGAPMMRRQPNWRGRTVF
jgi:phage terminase large subunit-like protein